MFRQAARSRLEYADVFPLIYLKFRFTGISPYQHVKHLLIDEMQDYTPIQYAVLSRLFICNKTILGDSNQQVNPYGSSTMEEIEKVFPGSETVLLRRSYRSTFQITNFAQNILPNKELIAIERHGEEPVIIGLANVNEELTSIQQMIEAFRMSGHQSMGIICKTQKQAAAMYKSLGGEASGINLLDEVSVSFLPGVTITSVPLAKGLEFDQVIIPNATVKNYHTTMDRSLLYIACTRAMHTLTITYQSKERLTGLIRG